VLMPNFVYDGITLSYFEKGAGIPLVFIHGALGSKNLWKNQVNALSKQYRVIAFDVRGHGDSTKPEKGYGPKGMLGDLTALLDHLKLDHVVLIGSSMGGVLAQMFCLSNPDRVLALVLVGTLARAYWLSSQEQYSQTNFEEIVEKGVRHWFTNNSIPENFDFALQQAKLSTPNFILHVQEDFGNYDFRNQLQSITQSTLIIVGKEDRTTPPAESEIIKNGIKNSELHIISNSGHLVMLEQPEVFNQIVLEFLKKRVSRTVPGKAP
jgi:pimeloyl-ACP methyl ester carboxylesterase